MTRAQKTAAKFEIYVVELQISPPFFDLSQNTFCEIIPSHTWFSVRPDVLLADLRSTAKLCLRPENVFSGLGRAAAAARLSQKSDFCENIILLCRGSMHFAFKVCWGLDPVRLFSPGVRYGFGASAKTRA